MNMSKGRSKGGCYEAGHSFRNIEFIIITKEHAGTLIHGVVSPWPCSLGSMVLLSFKGVSLGLLFFNLHFTTLVQSLPRLHIPPLPGPFLPPLFSEHFVWLLYTKFTKWVVHSFRASFFIIILCCYLNISLL